MKKMILLLTLLSSNLIYGLDMGIRPLNKFKADFKKEQYLKSANFTLTSTGQVELKNAQKLIWDQKKPFPYLVTLTPEGAVSDGKKMKGLSSPQMGRMFKTFFAVIQGKQEELKKHFSLHQKGKKIELRPLSENVKKFMKYLVVIPNKKKQIAGFELYEVSGNKTKVQFSNYR